ncbi:MAG TPA: hypothetical protein PLL10_09185 [Elusimicrobiales bacterium]|nr:hypothetical protein [Elusimicrobiales bacterium]
MMKKVPFYTIVVAALVFAFDSAFAKGSASSQLPAGDGGLTFLATVMDKPRMITTPIFVTPEPSKDDFGHFLEALAGNGEASVFNNLKGLFDMGGSVADTELAGWNVGEAVYMDGSVQRRTAAILKISHIASFKHWTAFFVAAEPVGVFSKMDDAAKKKVTQHIEKYMTCEFASPSADDTFAAVGTFAKSTRFIYVRRFGEFLMVKVEDSKPANRVYYAAFPAKEKQK